VSYSGWASCSGELFFVAVLTLERSPLGAGGSHGRRGLTPTLRLLVSPKRRTPSFGVAQAGGSVGPSRLGCAGREAP
jgi:hypothetical protein